VNLRRLVRVVLGVAAVVVLLAIVQLVRVHRATGEFRFAAAAAPPRLHEYGRLYLRGRSAPGQTAAPKGTQQIDSTMGGGDVLGPRRIATQGAPQAIVPTVIWVRDGDGVWTYELSGGP
jgi:hypothetical protein